MKRVLLFLAVIVVMVVVVGCDGDGVITDDNRFNGEYVDTSSVDLMYYIPKDGVVYEDGKVTFYIDYTVDPTEFALDGFYLHALGKFEKSDWYYVSEKIYVHDYSGLIPVNFLIPKEEYSGMIGYDILLFCQLYKYRNTTTFKLAVSDTIVIQCK